MAKDFVFSDYVIYLFHECCSRAFSALTLLVRRHEGHPAWKKQRWGAGMVICLERGADLHIAQLMPLPLTVSCFSKILTGFTFLVPAHLGSPGKGPLNVCVCCSRCKFQPYDCIVIRFVEWSRFSPLSYFVSRLVWQCDSWSVATRQPQSQEGDWVRAHLCKLARHRPWRVRKRFIRDHVSD